MAGPKDISMVFKNAGGELIVVDARGWPFKYDPTANPDGPQSFEVAGWRGETLLAIDSGGYAWTYDLAGEVWRKGGIVEAAEGQTGQWLAGDNIDGRQTLPVEAPVAPAPQASAASGTAAGGGQ